MTWTCPACQFAIQHADSAPRRSVVYRCPVCRLELILNGEGDKLIVAPLPDEKPPTANTTVAAVPTKARDARPSRQRKKKSAKPAR